MSSWKLGNPNNFEFKLWNPPGRWRLSCRWHIIAKICKSKFLTERERRTKAVERLTSWSLHRDPLQWFWCTRRTVGASLRGVKPAGWWRIWDWKNEAGFFSLSLFRFWSSEKAKSQIENLNRVLIWSGDFRESLKPLYKRHLLNACQTQTFLIITCLEGSWRSLGSSARLLECFKESLSVRDSHWNLDWDSH